MFFNAIMYKSCGASDVEFVTSPAANLMHGIYGRHRLVFEIWQFVLVHVFGCSERGLSVNRICERLVLDSLLCGRFW